MSLQTIDLLHIDGAPVIDGLIFRRFGGASDYAAMADVINAGKIVDQIERTSTADEIAHTYTHLSNCDPYTDMICAEVDGELIGYGRGFWYQEADATRLYVHIAFLKPVWRRKGIGTAMLRFLQGRLREIAATHPADGPRFFATFAVETEVGTEALLCKHGYVAVRHGFDMVRPTLDDLPDAPMPAGLEVRPVLPEHYRLIWEADSEAFQDHWGYSPPTEEDYQGWLSNPVIFTPELWRVAWDVETNQVAGMVRSFINHAENAEYNRKRGYAEFISVRRPWRKRGLARSLIVQSLHLLNEHGMTEAALGVDAENQSGALRLYESVGFRVVKRASTYRKPLDDD